MQLLATVLSYHFINIYCYQLNKWLFFRSLTCVQISYILETPHFCNKVTSAYIFVFSWVLTWEIGYYEHETYFCSSSYVARKTWLSTFSVQLIYGNFTARVPPLLEIIEICGAPVIFWYFSVSNHRNKLPFHNPMLSRYEVQF